MNWRPWPPGSRAAVWGQLSSPGLAPFGLPERLMLWHYRCFARTIHCTLRIWERSSFWACFGSTFRKPVSSSSRLDYFVFPGTLNNAHRPSSLWWIISTCRGTKVESTYRFCVLGPLRRRTTCTSSFRKFLYNAHHRRRLIIKLHWEDTPHHRGSSSSSSPLP